MEVPEHLNGGYMRARIIDDTLTAVFDEILEQLESFVYLSPLACFFLHKAGIDARHDLVEVLEIERSIRIVQFA
jgi:hypothetical protein